MPARKTVMPSIASSASRCLFTSGYSERLMDPNVLIQGSDPSRAASGLRSTSCASAAL